MNKMKESATKSFGSILKENPNNIFNIVDGFVKGCLSQGKQIPEIQNTILELVNKNKQNPDNMLKGTNSIILNPGIPAVRDFLLNTCEEVIKNYDVDGIHSHFVFVLSVSSLFANAIYLWYFILFISRVHTLLAT